MIKINSRIGMIIGFQFLLLVGLLGFMSACTSRAKVPETKPGLSGTEKLLVLPFKNLSKQNGETGIIRCPACGTAFVTGQVSQSADQLLTDHLVSFLNGNRRFKIISSHQPITVQSESFSTDTNLLAEHQALISAGHTAKTELVLAGYIFRFKQRIGTNYSVQSPASIAFGIHLISVADGSSIWYGHYDETQQSLSENLFRLRLFFKRKWKWITAEEMAISALDESLETFPGP
jgi:hypothetical protein